MKKFFSFKQNWKISRPIFLIWFFVFSLIGFSSLIGFLLVQAQTWQEPSTNPPAGQLPGPVWLQSNLPGVLQTGHIFVQDKVGIGTASPNRLLHVYEDSGDNAEIDLQSVAGYNNHWAIYVNRGTENEPDYNQLRFWQGENRLTITPAGNIGIGLDNPQYKLDVAGTVRAIDFCLKGVGDTCEPPFRFGSFIGLTQNSYDGNQGGYTGANQKCAAQFAGSHLCTTEEILYTINNGGSLPNGSYWISNGSPGYFANVNDCLGWSSDSSSNYGTIWWKLGDGRTFGALNSCNSSEKFACCK